MKDENKTNKQLVDELKKLCRRITEPGHEEAGRKKAEEKIKHINLALRAIQNVHKLLLKEKDRGKLINSVCDNLVETPGYFNTWISLLDESGRYLTSAEAGLGKDFLPMIELMKSGKIMACGKNALKQSDVVITETPPEECKDCPLSGQYAGRAGITIRLEYEGKICGLMAVSIPMAVIKNKEECNLLKDVAKDIAFALHNIEVEEEHKWAHAELKNKMNELEIFNDAAVDRELIINELRKEINELLTKSGKEPKYEIAE